MTLPKISVPIYELVLPSTKEKINFRPFTVKEEKVLLTVLAHDDPSAEDISRASKQIINNCIVSPEFDIDKLTYFDIEYIMLQLRINSQGSDLSIDFKPIKNSTCPECSKTRTVKINLNDAKIVFPEKEFKKIQLTEKVGLIMKYPLIEVMIDYEKVLSKRSDITDIYKIMTKCIDFVYDEETSYKFSDYSMEDQLEFLENLEESKVSKIRDFFENMPTLRQDVHINCKTCGFSAIYPLKGYKSFFP